MRGKYTYIIHSITNKTEYTIKLQTLHRLEIFALLHTGCNKGA